MTSFHCYIADNVAYGDNAVQINTYDEAKAVYEPVKDNETSEVKGLVCCICFSIVFMLSKYCTTFNYIHLMSYEVPYNASNTYSSPDSNELVSG